MIVPSSMMKLWSSSQLLGLTSVLSVPSALPVTNLCVIV